MVVCGCDVVSRLFRQAAGKRPNMDSPSDSSLKLNKKVNLVYGYSKDWTAHDFYGKYHLCHIKNPLPTPGTQLQLEFEHKEKKQADIKRYEEARELKQQETQKLMELKKKTTEFTTRVHVHTLIGEPSDQAERVLQENYNLATKKIIFPDTQLAIDRFMKNILLGRAHYVSYAVTTGYKSIDWQSQDQLGYTALHLGIVKGYVDVVSELLKYNADPNISSGIGNYPLHDVWVFWKAPARTNIRLEQEQKTNEMIRLLCGYGANPNCHCTLDGSTPLHIACRLGPVHSVILLLGFQADYLIRNKSNETCLDVARHHGKQEIIRILEYWDGIRTQLVHLDFIIQWKMFLGDSEAIISSVSDQSVEKIMFELKMRENMREQDANRLGGINNFPVDDPFLLQCKYERNFIEKLKNQNKFYQENETEKENDNQSITTSGTSSLTIPGQEGNREKESIQSHTTYEPGSWQSLTGFGKTKLDKKRTKRGKRKLPPVRDYYMKILAANGPTLPKAWNPTEKNKHMIARLPSKVFIEEEEGEKEGEGEEEENDDDQDSEESQEKSQDDQNETKIDPGINTDKEKEKKKETNTEAGEVEVDRITTFFADSSSSPPPLSPIKPKTSQLHSRRQVVAQRVCLDGKFEGFTLRPCTSSALNLSRRTENAPLKKTVEEHSLSRYLTTTSQVKKIIAGNLIGLDEKEKERRELLQLTRGKKNTTAIGSYRGNDSEYLMKRNERELLYQRLSDEKSTQSTDRERGMSSSNLREIDREKTWKGSKIDMNAKEDRCLFVSKDLIPPLKELKNIDDLKARLREELGANGGGEDEELSDILSQSSLHSQSQHSVSHESDGLSLVDPIELLKQERERKERQQVKYGEGRITSTHRMKKIVQDPWSKVRGNYKIAVNI